MSGIKDYRIVQANNTSLNGIDVAEGMLPSNLNNAIRALMVNVREWYNDSEWVIYGDGDGAFTSAYVSASSFTINGSDVTAIYHTNRRVKVYLGSSAVYRYGTISSSSFSTNTTVNVTWDSGTLLNETLTIYLGALSATNNSIPPNVLIPADNSISTAKLVNGAVTADKLASTLDVSGKTITLPDGNISSAKLATDSVITSKILNSNITTAKIADSNITTAKIADDAVTIGKIADAAIVTNSEQSGHTPNDTTFYTTSAADTRFLNKDTSELINSTQTWSDSNDFIATTAAISNRITNLVDEVGGFVPIANETSFPNTNPDINDGAGTIVSVATLASSHTANGSGVITIANGTVGNSTVTLNNCGANAVLAAGFGILVESTTTNHTYNFHRLVPKANDVSTLAGISSAITGVNNISSAVTSVNNNSANINTVATNIVSVNSFANTYSFGSSNPSSGMSAGDLFFNTTQNILYVFNGSSWQNAGSSVNGTSQRFTYTISGTPTTVTGNDNNGNSLSYDGGFIDVFLNGIKQVNGVDVTVTSGTSVVFASALAAGDIVDLVAYGTFNVAALSAGNISSGTLNNARLPSTISDKTIQASTPLTVKGDGSSADGKLVLNCSQNSHGVGIQAPPHSANATYTLILPVNTGSSGQVLSTNGSGTLSWIAQPTGETKPTIANVSQTIAPSSATTINITGTNFSGIPTVEFIKSDTGAITSANTVSLTNATTLSVNCTLASGTYYVRIELDDGNAARSANAIITASTAPSFSTNAGSLGTFAGNFSGTLATIAGSSDSAITFAETTSVLSGAGVTLNSSTGALTTSDFGGSSTTPTTYTFTIRITDQEAQTTTRQFSMTSSFSATGGGQFN